jgi:hypothetical protein
MLPEPLCVGRIECLAGDLLFLDQRDQLFD